MRSAVVLALAALAAAPTEAVSDYEGERSTTAVAYRDGTRAEVVCDRDYFCSVTVENSSGSWTIRPDGFPGLIVLPSQLAVVSPPLDGKFVVEVEVACASYSESPPPFICLAQVTVQDARVTKAVVLKRSLVDERGDFAKTPAD
jgi:hypothetical protein